eukprot:120565-Pelagomonas_calceolata.AAC.8
MPELSSSFSLQSCAQHPPPERKGKERKGKERKGKDHIVEKKRKKEKSTPAQKAACIKERSLNQQASKGLTKGPSRLH